MLSCIADPDGRVPNPSIAQSAREGCGSPPAGSQEHPAAVGSPIPPASSRESERDQLAGSNRVGGIRHPGWKTRREIATLLIPERLLAWHSILVAQKYDGSAGRCPGRPRVMTAIRRRNVEMAQQNRS